MLNWLQRLLPAGAKADAKAKARAGEEAEAALARGDRRGAEMLYRKALESEPGNPTLHLGLGYALLGQDTIEDALQAARRALELAPDYADAAFWLGLNLQGLGRHTDAAQVLDQGLTYHPAQANLLSLRASVHCSLGQLDAAENRYQDALAQQPDHVPALSGLGSLKLERNDTQGAIELLRRAVDLQPYSGPTLYVLGKALQTAGQADEAMACYEQALEDVPGLGQAHRNLAILLRQRGALPEAIGHFRQALAAMPGERDLLNRLTEALLAAGDFAEAVECSRIVLDSEPQNLEALVNLGSALQGLRRYVEAAEAYQKALAIEPGHPAILYNLGTLKQSEGYFSRGAARRVAFAEAKQAYEGTIAHESTLPGDARHIDTLLCLASLAMADLRLDEALAHLDEALALQPENPDARTRRGQLALLMGDFAAGWRDYEYRFAQSGNKPLPPFTQPLWRNDFSLAGKTVLLLAEQGMGDTIHFARYVEQVAQQAPAAILIEAHEALRTLLGTLPVPAHVPLIVLEPGRPFPPFDCYCPLMSLPFAFGTRSDTIAARIPYLAAEPARIAHWAERLGEKTPDRIGIVWSGSPDLNNDFHRSIALERFAELLPPTLRVHSLQKDVRDTDSETLRRLPNVIHFGAELHDYSDTAALIANLDLVISVDTSVAHLAGAMGKPVWILLPFLPDYRWLIGRGDSPWYPTARLFRQSEAGDWSTVFAQVRQALDNRMSSIQAAP